MASKQEIKETDPFAPSFDNTDAPEGVIDFDDTPIDLEGVSDAGPTPLPSGVYDAIVESVEKFVASTGNKGLKWTFAVIDPVTGKTRKVYHNTMLMESTMGMVKQAVRVLAPSLLGQPFTPAALAMEATSARCQIQLGIRAYQQDGETRTNNTVKKILPQRDVQLSF